MVIKMFEFVKIKSKKLRYGYVLKITNLFQLLCYTMDYNQSFYSKEFLDYVKNKKSINSINSYIKNIIEKRNSSYVDKLSKILSEILRFQMKSLEQCGCIYIQSVKSWMEKSDDIIEYGNSIFNEKCIFPDNTEIKIFKWPYGVHWQARIGDTDVIVNNISKWNTYEEAKRNSEIFLKSN